MRAEGTAVESECRRYPERAGVKARATNAKCRGGRPQGHSRARLLRREVSWKPDGRWLQGRSSARLLRREGSCESHERRLQGRAGAALVRVLLASRQPVGRRLQWQAGVACSRRKMVPREPAGGRLQCRARVDVGVLSRHHRRRRLPRHRKADPDTALMLHFCHVHQVLLRRHALLPVELAVFHAFLRVNFFLLFPSLSRGSALL